MDETSVNKNLFLKKLEFNNYRNYPHFELSEIEPLTIFVGQNAIGKTNILEGIQLLASQSSFRNPGTSELVLWGKENTSIKGLFSNRSRNLDFEMKVIEGKRKYFVNGKKKNIQELKGIVSSVMFSPDDLTLVKGSNSARRNAYDQIGSQISTNYYVIKKDYDRILAQKNQLLKHDYSSSLLESVNETLIKIGTQLFCYRFSLYKRIKALFIELYPQIINEIEQGDIEYKASWDEIISSTEYDMNEKDQVSRVFREVLELKRSEEKERKRSLIGPHKDIFTFLINNKDAKTYGSQGQQRSLVLCFKLSEVKLIQNMLDQQPILLLDDVMSELDEQRRNALIGFISESIQTFITTTNLHYFNEEILDKAQVIYLPREV